MEIKEQPERIERSQISQFFSTMYSSKETWKFRKILWPLTALILIVGAIVSSVAPMVPMWNRSYENIVVNHPQLEVAMSEIYDNNINCKITQVDKALKCTDWNDFNVTGYKVTLQSEGYNIENLSESQIIFSEKLFAVLTIVGTGINQEKHYFNGNYSTIAADFDFAKFYTDNNSKPDKEQIYKTQTKNMIRGIYLSTLPENSLAILSTHSVQYLITILVISLVFMMLNYRSHSKIIKYSESLTTVIIIALWAGFISAIVALMHTVLGSVTFYSVMSLKAVFLYVYLLKEKKAMGVSGM